MYDIYCRERLSSAFVRHKRYISLTVPSFYLLLPHLLLHPSSCVCLKNLQGKYDTKGGNIALQLFALLLGRLNILEGGLFVVI